jgi:hypothetical protein
VTEGSSHARHHVRIGPDEDPERLAKCVAEIQRIPALFEGYEARVA